MLRKKTNLHFLLEDETLNEILDFPQNIQPTGQIKRETKRIDEGEHFTGKAAGLIHIENKQEKDLIQWSYESATRIKKYEWLDNPIQAHVPSLHNCALGRPGKKSIIGHHESWCIEKRETVTTTVQQEKIIEDPN